MRKLGIGWWLTAEIASPILRAKISRAIAPPPTERYFFAIALTLSSRWCYCTSCWWNSCSRVFQSSSYHSTQRVGRCPGGGGRAAIGAGNELQWLDWEGWRVEQLRAIKTSWSCVHSLRFQGQTDGAFVVVKEKKIFFFLFWIGP